MPHIMADRRLWLTADKARVVEDGDPEAAFLLAAPGHPILEADVKRLGLGVKDGCVVLKARRKAEDKAVHASPEDKAGEE